VTPDDLRELFSMFGPVDIRRMFGGAGVFVDRMMIGLIHQDVIYLKADAQSAAAFDREGLGCFTYSRSGKQASLSSFRRMPDRLYDDPDELAVWAREALAAAGRGRANPRIAGGSRGTSRDGRR
jgi:DNA transformation protein and related proteins